LGKTNLTPSASAVAYAEPLNDPDSKLAETGAPEALGKTSLSPSASKVAYAQPLNDPDSKLAETGAPEALGKTSLSPSASKLAYAEPLNDPDSTLAETGAPDAMSKTALAAKQAEKVSFSVPNPETTDVNLVATAENPPAPTAVGKVSLNPKKPAAVAVSPVLTAPEIAPQKVEVALTPQEALPPVERKPEVTEREPEVSERKPEVVESLTKGAEMLNKMGALRLDNLAKGTYYIQIGVFKAATGAAQRLKVIGMDYPIVYQEVTLNSTPVYKLFVGPVNKDESGLILLKLKSQGFTDVFLKKAN
jgi:hypothetical protein